MEYIEKKKALDAIWQGCGACAEEVEQLPVVEIVRCKECRWKFGAECTAFAYVSPMPDDFCSRGVRKES